jgi:hypothetical protein
VVVVVWCLRFVVGLVVVIVVVAVEWWLVLFSVSWAELEMVGSAVYVCSWWWVVMIVE